MKIKFRQAPLTLFVFSFLFATVSWAQSSELDDSVFFKTSYDQSIHRKRNAFWPAMGSFFAPGINQWIEGQHKSAALYSGGALLATALQISALSEVADSTETLINPQDFAEAGDPIKKIVVGDAIYKTMGGLSALHAFKTSVHWHKDHTDRFSFIDPHREKMKDVILAPFAFSNLKRMTTLIPLATIGLLAATTSFEAGNRGINIGDSLFIGSVSYGAGVGEEALFRGFLLPYMYDSWNNFFWSNTAQSLVFAALHINAELTVPVWQFALGYYFGWITHQNHWSIEESVFIHTWWDVIAFTATFAAAKTRGTSIYFPIVQSTF